MKKFLTYTFLIISCITHAQIQWQKSLGGSGDDGAYSVTLTVDGGYIIAGSTNSNDVQVTNSHGGGDVWIVKMDNGGNMQWQKTYGGDSLEEANCIIQTTDRGYLFAGYSYSNNGDINGHHGSRQLCDYWVVKIDSMGNIQWQKSLGGSYNDFAYQAKITPDGGFVITGYSESNDGDVTGNHGSYDYWIVKLDSSGNLLWQKTYGGSASDMAYSIDLTTDGGFIVAGVSGSNNGNVSGNHGGGDFWLIKLNSLGSLQWQKSYGGTDHEIAYSIKQTSDGGFITTGTSYYADGDVTNHHGSSFATDVWVVKTDSLGTLIWEKSYGGSDDDVGYCIQQTSDGGYIVAGYSGSIDGDLIGSNHHGPLSYEDMWIFKLDSIGTIQWQRCFGGYSTEIAYSILQTPDGGYIAGGYSASNDGDVALHIGPLGRTDMWIIKLSPDVGIGEMGSSVEVNLYPNPSTDKVVISGLTSKNYKITINDVSGNSVEQWKEEKNQSEIPINLSGLANGVYMMRIESEKNIITKKIIKN